MDLRAYIEERSIPIPFDGCWMWMLSFGSHGYGQAFCPPDRVTTAHRVAYRAFKGPIPEGMLVQHKCDRPWCVNPDHLELGTDKTNALDKVRKGRDGREKKRGKLSPCRHLTPEQVTLIRSMRGTQREIAKLVGATQSQVARIQQGKIYREISSTAYPEVFKLGDKVFWVTANYGGRHLKTGAVVEIVLPNNAPLLRPTDWRGAVPRRHVSYVVAVEQGQRLLRYWPIASELKLVTST